MNQDQAIQLYQLFHSSQNTALDLHHKWCQQALTLISAIMAATLFGLFHFHTNLWGIVVVIGPVLSIATALLAMSACRRMYRRFLENVTLAAKVGEDAGLAARTAIPGMCFPQDSQYIPERWMEARAKQDNATDFVKTRLKTGVNAHVRVLLWIMAVVNLVLLLVCIAAPLIARFCPNLSGK